MNNSIKRHLLVHTIHVNHSPFPLLSFPLFLFSLPTISRRIGRKITQPDLTKRADQQRNIKESVITKFRNGEIESNRNVPSKVTGYDESQTANSGIIQTSPMHEQLCELNGEDNNVKGKKPSEKNDINDRY